MIRQTPGLLHTWPRLNTGMWLTLSEVTTHTARA